MELATETRACDKGWNEAYDEAYAKAWRDGYEQGMVQATLNTARIAGLPAAVVPALMDANFDGVSERAHRALEVYLRDHPEKAAWLKSAN